MLKLIPVCTLTGFALTAHTVHASLIINEIDYDQPGADTAEFIELYNNGSAGLPLDGYRIDLINGADSTVYRTIDLTGFSLDANGYFVVCDNTSLVANCNFSFTPSPSWFQNGAPDAVALYDNSGSLIDSLAYEGLLAGFTEGNASTLADSNTDVLSLSRIPDGFDSDDNAANFQLGCITPGTANIAGTGDCSVPAVGNVPLPPAIWLFGSGLLGMISISRRKS